MVTVSLRIEVHAQEHSEREREREKQPRLRGRRLKVGTMLKRKLENLCFVTLLHPVLRSSINLGSGPCLEKFLSV